MTVFYRKYRPQSFSEMVGQEHVKKSLLVALESGKISHGYLFSGPRGTGKTSTARILAKAVNCEVYGSSEIVHGKSKTINDERLTINKFGEPCNKCANCVAITDGSSLDLIEIDAASNRGIDEIRDLREKIKLSPVCSRYKVYIIDEVHMLTNEAFNALLKTLEEPPSHAIFILCTTEPGKLPETIISRLVRFNFSRASASNVGEYLKRITDKEKIKIEKKALEAIAKAADGSYRDSASILEQFGGSDISEEDVKGIVNASGWNQVLELLVFLFEHDLKRSLDLVESLEGNVDFSNFTLDVTSALKALLFIKIGVTVPDSFGAEKVEQLSEMAKDVSVFEIKKLIRLMLIAENEIRNYSSEQMPLILAFCDFCEDSIKPDTSGETEVKVEPEKPKEETAKVQGKKAEKKTEGIKVVIESGNLNEVEQHWGEFLGRVKPINAHVGALLKSSRPLAYDGRILSLEVFFRFHKDKLEEPKIMNMLCDTISGVMGNKISFKFVLSDRKTALPKPVLMSNVSDVDSSALSQVAQEIFAK